MEDHEAAKLKRRFDGAMLDIYRRAKAEAGYTATIFHSLLEQQGGLTTARQLINAPKVSAGYTNLYMKNRLDLTVEAVVVENTCWHPLFTDEELQRARARLKEYRYVPR